MADWTEQYLDMICDCVMPSRIHRLTEWEQGFVESIRIQLEHKKELSVKQIEVLDRVWDKATKH